MTGGSTPGDDGDSSPGSSSSASTVLAAPPHLSRHLGRYQLIEVLGHGAMATVFRAKDGQLNRQVAVKVMNLAVAARSDSGERFRREAQAVAAIKHPGIVEIFDFVAASGHEPAYIVSELIEGPTLKSWLDGRSGRVLPEMAALLALPLAEALAVAHSRGVVHRDVKPDNVMIDRGPDAGGCRVVLTDFGVAHVTGLETMTATGALVGSPAYMSPEQARGHDVGPASDIWAAGVVLYELATGHLPFTGRDPLTVVAAITRGVYRKPSHVSPYASAAFDEICARCLQPDLAERYTSAAELAADLRAYCTSVGLEPGNETLHRWMSAPEPFEVSVRQRAADAAVAAARKHARRGEFARALMELSRATTYVPKHAEADRLIANISTRRRWLKLGAVAAAILAVGAGMLVLAPRLTGPDSEVDEGGAGAAGTGAQAPPTTPTGAGVAGAGPAGAAIAGASASPAPASKTKKRKGGGVRLSRGSKKEAAAVPAAATAAVVPEPASSPPAESPSEATTTEPPPAVTVPAPRPVSVEIYADLFFCNPGLGDGKAKVSPWKGRVAPGKHRVFCQQTNGERVQVATVEVAEPAPGQPFVIQLQKRADGRPEMDPKRTTRLSPGAGQTTGGTPP